MNWLAFSHGAALCASLIVTIGAQNAFVLRQGILRSHVGKIVVLCALSDFILIGAGVGGASALVERYPTFVHLVLYAGLAWLVWFGIGALRRAVKPTHAVLDAATQANAPEQRALPIMLMTLAFTWLNPHVYLDTFLLIGTAGAREPQGARLAFAIGAMCVSAVWFVGLGYGARAMAPLFRRASAWRVLDGAIGSMVLLIAFAQLR
ncbi:MULTISPECIES: LysE/ArgO family amino acid transporter [Paraburkholderia]|jgi:L-lysine exporter family protein LysE/ArgO|uniref:L-lysine exporter family protein LysE/ArgO n=1 Tax=Paraburkholderia tropica TaxID=92647 RepID=A0AAQ1JWS6_9BURK|nr:MULTISPECIES: LysE/ArgO family amino acid transporter [Paraburkholderia]MBB2999899.1 L-lysine exporter family protein LysE/ArgO [Paraburkholderia tropica]MBB6319530.1 L-lysine exporter family protein LysE/ArgO [Paraburkholderia tropica]MDE1142853.1 LysE/ArgO family amino acid transporter [Paraburkholderia tropica]PXX07558.1 L-lysine exporter family protein LysE/ArgO [Paraburkholderia tropica]PZW73036.1 L-lysine exporter family protein LysE/ArgO [Paraburkholderia tropica]